MAKMNIEPMDACMLMLCGSIAIMGGAAAYALVKSVNGPYTVDACYNTNPKENEDDILSEYADAIDFFDDFVDDYV